MDEGTLIEKFRDDIKHLEARINILERKDYLTLEGPVAYKYFEWLMESIQPDSLKRLLRELDKRTIGTAIIGLGKDPLLKLKSCVSKNAWNDIVDGVTGNGWMFLIHSARADILKTSRLLEEMGEIIVMLDSNLAIDAAERQKFSEYFRHNDRQDVQFDVKEWKSRLTDVFD